MINQEFLSNCTDEQINKGVAWLEVKEILEVARNFKSEFATICSNELLTNIQNYCALAGESWEIVEENKISLINDGKGWEASFDCRGFYSEAKPGDPHQITIANEKPLRAAMEVYILMSVTK
ncbi:MAG: DUF2591 domain-containing protein [Desulfobulbaceae bacterium]|nr:DUF2591 domain-containing protein [Aliivibrio sp.]MCP4338503.1 DUF2591 domain-containing protein [Desulfobulbaceae bacterium]